MSLVVLVLSWGSLGLEAATAVVSEGARPLGSGIQGAGGPNSWILEWWGPMPYVLRGRTWGPGSQVLRLGAGFLCPEVLAAWVLREEGAGARNPGSEGGDWRPGLLGLREKGLGVLSLWDCAIVAVFEPPFLLLLSGSQ